MFFFCDKPIHTITKRDFSLEYMQNLFLSVKNRTKIIIIKDEYNNFFGYTYYHRFLKFPDKLIQQEFLLPSSEIWKEAYNLFEQNKELDYIPVVDEEKNILTFCIQVDIPISQEIKDIMEDYRKDSELLFISELYKKIEVVYLYDCNELSYLFYVLLVHHGFKVVVIGDYWDAIFGIKTKELRYQSFQKMSIYSEGNTLIKHIDKHQIDQSWRFLYDMATINHVNLENKIRKKFREEGKLIFIGRLPGIGDLSDYTMEEIYRIQNYKDIDIDLGDISPLQNEQYEKIYGKSYKQIINDRRFIEQLLYPYKNNVKYGYQENIIYLIGPCIVNGYRNPLEETILYLLNRLLVLNKVPYSIKGIYIPKTQCSNFENILNSLSIKEKDMVILLGSKNTKLQEIFQYKDNVDIDFTQIYKERNKEEPWFFNVPVHGTGYANKAIAKELYEKIIEPNYKALDPSRTSKSLQKGKVLLSSSELESLEYFLEKIKKYKFLNSEDKRVGAIVMNCNPITKGHLYLIEYARKEVDYLYIFLVEEDKSVFTFVEREDLVRKATIHADNIKIIPSGKFIVSNKTLPGYFMKEYKKDIIIDASNDITLFSQYIAPALGIKIRFVGEEPLDFITLQYNIEMKRTLPDYGIEFVEIRRKEIKNQVISASRVRKLLKEGKWEEVKELVPENTFHYLKEEFDIKRIVDAYEERREV